MNGQLIAVAVIVCGAVFYLVRQTWRTWAGRSSGCSKGCGCGDKKTQPAGKLIPAEELTLRLRSEK